MLYYVILCYIMLYYIILYYKKGHSLNLGHSGEQDIYDDQSGMMGYSYNDMTTPKMCYNA
jgi:hypothetical protein